jgi:hypothetical protein
MYQANQTDDLVSTVKAEVARRRASAKSFTLASLELLHPCLRHCGASPPVSIESDVFFIVMGGSARMDRAQALRATWANGYADNVLIIGDKAAPEVGMITLPQLEGRADYAAAQERQMYALKHLLLGPDRARYAGYKWFALVDDDSWVNVRQIAPFLWGWSPSAPIIFGFIWDHPHWKTTHTWPSGPFMLLSRAAAEAMAPQFFTGSCPMSVPPLNDVTMGECAWTTGVALVHTPLVDPEGFRARPNTPVVELTNSAEVFSMLSIHRVQPEGMRGLQERLAGVSGQ